MNKLEVMIIIIGIGTFMGSLATGIAFASNASWKSKLFISLVTLLNTFNLIRYILKLE